MASLKGGCRFPVSYLPSVIYGVRYGNVPYYSNTRHNLGGRSLLTCLSLWQLLPLIDLHSKSLFRHPKFSALYDHTRVRVLGVGQKGRKTLGGGTRIRRVDRRGWVERGRLLHSAIKPKQLNRVIIHVPVNPIEIVLVLVKGS